MRGILNKISVVSRQQVVLTGQYILKYRELIVWQKAMAFTVVIYKESQNWLSDKIYGLEIPFE
jgi:hypothetical protein